MIAVRLALLPLRSSTEDLQALRQGVQLLPSYGFPSGGNDPEVARDRDVLASSRRMLALVVADRHEVLAGFQCRDLEGSSDAGPVTQSRDVLHAFGRPVGLDLTDAVNVGVPDLGEEQSVLRTLDPFQVEVVGPVSAHPGFVLRVESRGDAHLGAGNVVCLVEFDPVAAAGGCRRGDEEAHPDDESGDPGPHIR